MTCLGTRSLLFTLIQADVVKRQKQNALLNSMIIVFMRRDRCRNWKGTSLGDYMS